MPRSGPRSLPSVQARRNVVSLVTQAKTDCRFFPPLVFSTENCLWETLWETWSPETLAYNQTQEPQCPDSATITTTTGSCSDSVLSKELRAVVYSNDLSCNEPEPTFPWWFYERRCHISASVVVPASTPPRHKNSVFNNFVIWDY